MSYTFSVIAAAAVAAKSKEWNKPGKRTHTHTRMHTLYTHDVVAGLHNYLF